MKASIKEVPLSIPSGITVNDNKKDVSLISTDNTKLYLARSKQQVQNLKLDNLKNQKK